MYLLDSDTLVFLLREDPNVCRSFRAHSSDPLATSVISYGELFYGALRSGRPQVNQAKVGVLRETLLILPVTPSIMETFCRLRIDLERAGARLDEFDLLIAATALSANYRLVTHNTKHFQRVPGLVLADWTLLE